MITPEKYEGDYGSIGLLIGESLYIQSNQYRITKYQIDKRSDLVELQLKASGTGGSISFLLELGLHQSTITLRAITGGEDLRWGFNAIPTPSDDPYTTRPKQYQADLLSPEEAAFLK